MTNFKRVNLAIVFNPEHTHVLMCLRQTEPYKGLYNFVGGKVEVDETSMDAVYRELFEETGITRENVLLQPLFTTQYFIDAIELQVYFGSLNHQVELKPEKHPLVWMELNHDFSDDKLFAGQGNIKHMLDLIECYS